MYFYAKLRGIVNKTSIERRVSRKGEEVKAKSMKIFVCLMRIWAFIKTRKFEI